MRSEITKRILKEIDAQPWHIKVWRWFIIKAEVFYCLVIKKYFK